MSLQARERMVADYRNRFQRYGDQPESVGMSSDGQRFRFRKLMEIGDLRNRRVLDLGCGIGSFYPFLIEGFGQVEYTGIDLVGEMVDFAAKKYPRARFLCHDLFAADLKETFDYVLISTVFNYAMTGSEDYIRKLITLAFKHCTRGLGFNFLSTHANFTDIEMAYYDPAQMLDFCIRNLTRKVLMHHHYERADVVVFAYR
ncbi:MAG TPA: methyltransferase domain-containing protein [Gemmataceae bacterium]|nr:methyltransferase domain-containing protein [Gemmataceae bacterium]